MEYQFTVSNTQRLLLIAVVVSYEYVKRFSVPERPMSRTCRGKYDTCTKSTYYCTCMSFVFGEIRSRGAAFQMIDTRSPWRDSPVARMIQYDT